MVCGLRWLPDGHLPMDEQRPGVNVKIVPSQAKQFAAARPEGERHHVGRFQPVTAGGRN
jgi:hypothetical protein